MKVAREITIIDKREERREREREKWCGSQRQKNDGGKAETRETTKLGGRNKTVYKGPTIYQYTFNYGHYYSDNLPQFIVIIGVKENSYSILLCSLTIITIILPYV